MRQIDGTKSPRFSQVTTFGRLPLCSGDGEKALFLGIPFDDGVVYRPGARFGPSGIREGSRLLRPYNQFLRTYPFDDLQACDGGDVDTVPGYIEDTMHRIQTSMKPLLERDIIPFIGGGDHSITLPVLRALYSRRGKVGLLHIDSHYDFWNSHFGRKYNHGTWLRRAIEENIVGKVMQVGIRGSIFSHEDISDGIRMGIRTLNIREVKQMGIERVNEEIKSYFQGMEVYLSFDIDAVDPAFAPGTGTPEVGGLTSYEALELVRGLGIRLIGMDVVEVSPPYDVSQVTSMLAANLIYEGMSLVAKDIGNLKASNP